MEFAKSQEANSSNASRWAKGMWAEIGIHIGIGIRKAGGTNDVKSDIIQSIYAAMSPGRRTQVG